MGTRRSKLTRDETLRVMRIVADVASYKADPAARRRHLIDALLAIAGCDIGFTYVADRWDARESPPFLAAVNSTGSDALFDGYAAEVIAPHGLRADPFCATTLGRSDRLVSLGRRDALPDVPAHRRCEPFVGFLKKVSMGDGAVCFARLDARAAAGRPAVIVGVGAHRCDGGRSPLRPRDRAMIDLAVTEYAGLIARGRLAVPELAAPDPAADADPFTRLSPRPRAVLRLLLAGESPKAIARALGISLWTVREHQSAVYRHFGVAGRDELMARFLGGDAD